MSCADCDESLDLCTVCRKGICPVHRIGTGDLAMGYACSMTCSMSAWGPTYQKKHARPIRAVVSVFDRYGYVNVLALVFIVLWSIVGLLHLIFG